MTSSCCHLTVAAAAAFVADPKHGPRPAVLIPLEDGRYFAVVGASAPKCWRQHAELFEGEDRRMIDAAIAKLLPAEAA